MTEKIDMLNVYLKDGSTVQISAEEIEEYLYENDDKIEYQHVERRGPRRGKIAQESRTAVSHITKNASNEVDNKSNLDIRPSPRINSTHLDSGEAFEHSRSS